MHCAYDFTSYRASIYLTESSAARSASIDYAGAVLSHKCNASYSAQMSIRAPGTSEEHSDNRKSQELRICPVYFEEDRASNNGITAFILIMPGPKGLAWQCLGTEYHLMSNVTPNAHNKKAIGGLRY